LARNLTVEINDYKEADTFKAEIDYKSFPFDPRTIRACKVSVYMEDRKSIFAGEGNKLNILVPSSDNVVFIGYADEEGITFNDTSRIVSLNGRDLTCLFTDSKYLGAHIPLTKPVNEIIQDLINQQESTKKISVVNNTGGDLPILANLAPDLESTSGIVNPKRNGTFWDMIQEIIERAGLICYMDLDKLIINKPRNLYKKQKIKNFIYGKNLSSLSFERKLGRHKGFNIQVRSVNVIKKTLLEAKIPLESNRGDIGGGVEVTIPQLDKDGKKIEPQQAAPYLSFNVPDISSKEKLIEVGESIYEELSRQQLEGKLETKEMELPETAYREDKNGNYVPYVDKETMPVSFASIRNGSAIQVYIDVNDMEKIRTLSSMSERKRYLILQQFEPKVAEALAESLNRTAYVFYVKSVTFKINQDTGFSMEIDFINFIELDNAGLGV